MIITKMALPRTDVPARHGGGARAAAARRDGAGASPRRHRRRSRVPRLGFFYAPNGTYLPNFHPVGVGSELRVHAGPEAARAARATHRRRQRPGEQGRGEPERRRRRAHARRHAWLSGIRPKKTEGADIEAGTSIDQMAAAVIGKDTPLNSLQLALDYDFVVGSCENGYSCVYQRTFSWKSPTTPMPMESNPRAVFERLFGEGGTAAERVRADAAGPQHPRPGAGGHGAADAAPRRRRSSRRSTST